MPIWVQTILAILSGITDLAMKIVPLIQQGQTTISETNADAIHEHLVKAEEATAAVRKVTDDMLTQAAGNQS